MTTTSTESLETESETATFEGGLSKFMAINTVRQTDITPEGDSADRATHAPDTVKEAVVNQGDDNVKGAKRKRASSPSNGTGLDGASDLPHEASKLKDVPEGSGATSETGKGPEAKKGRNKAGAAKKKDGKVKPAPTKKVTSAGGKEKGRVTKGKAAGAEGDTVSEAKEVDNYNDGQSQAGLVTTTPPDDASGDENLQTKRKKTSTGAKPAGKKVWSPAEDALIMELCATKTPFKEITAALNGLSSNSTTLVIDQKMAANRWNNVLKHIITWSDEEVKTLKTIYDAIVKDPYSALADRMNKELEETKFTKQGCEKKIKEMMKENKAVP